MHKSLITMWCAHNNSFVKSIIYFLTFNRILVTDFDSWEPAVTIYLLSFCSVQLQQLWSEVIVEDGKDQSDCNRIWQSCHYIIIETVRRHLAGKSCKGAATSIVLVLLKP